MSGFSIGNGLSKGVGLSVGSGFSRGGGLYFSGFSVAPTLDLNFTTMTALPSTITFSRPSNATYYDSTGKLTYAPNNLSTFSENFSGAAWQVSNFTRTTGQSDPLGASNGTLGTFTSNGGNGLSQSALSLTADKSYIVSIYAKYGTWRWFEFTTVISGLYTRSWVDMQNGVAGATVAHASFAVTNVGSGWYRISAKISGTSEFYWTPRDANGNAAAATTNNGATFLVFGFQAEAVTYQTTPGTYTATTSAAYYGARLDYNPATLAARGLLIEEARTNLSTLSDSWGNGIAGSNITKTTGVADPAGGTNAITLTATGTSAWNSQNYYYSEVSGVSGTISNTIFVRRRTGTGSVIICKPDGTQGATLSLTSSWQRFTSTGAPLSGSAYVQIDVLTSGDAVDVFGVQIEQGSFATSYIPTAASSVARSADTVSMTGTNFSSWYNQSEGTFVVNAGYEGLSPSDYNTLFTVNDGSILTNNIRFLRDPTNGFFNVDYWSGSSQVAAFSNSTITVAGTFYKTSSAYKVNDFAASFSGGSVATDTSGAVPVSPNKLFFAGYNSTQTNAALWIASLVYYPQRLPNATLQSLTAPDTAPTGNGLVWGDGNYLIWDTGNFLTWG
jgi:hypothetical protein